MKKSTTFPVLAILSLLLSGFTIRPAALKADDFRMTIHFTTTVKADGSGKMAIEMYASKDLVEYTEEQSDIDFDDACEQIFSNYSRFKVAQKNPGGAFQCIASADFEDLDELESILEDDIGATVYRLEIEEKRFYYDVSFYNIYSSTDEIETEVLWILVLPGTPGDTNADKTSGRTLTWDITDSYGSQRFKAESGVSAGFLGMDSSTLAIVMVLMMSCCCVILLIVAGIAVFLILRKQNPSAAEESSMDANIPLS
jgi:hypothetical protein